MLAQAIAADFIKEGYLESHLPKVQNLYRERLSALLAGLAKNLPAGFSYSQPEGGMYVWVEGPAGFDNKAAYDASLKRNVAFVPGQHFFADSRRGRNAFRLNFTNATPDKLSEATRVIGEVLA